jgi:hypothetical protein
MTKTHLRLTLDSASNHPVTEKQIEIIAKALNGWFQDADFTLTTNDDGLRLQAGQLERNRATAALNDWEAQAVTQMLSSESPVRLINADGDKVRIHRLKKKLPRGVILQSKRAGNYLLVNS